MGVIHYGNCTTTSKHRQAGQYKYKDRKGFPIQKDPLPLEILGFPFTLQIIHIIIKRGGIL